MKQPTPSGRPRTRRAEVQSRVLHVRASPRILARLRKIARARKVSESEALRTLIEKCR